MIDSDLDLSRLRTISSFDRGTSSTMAVGVAQPCFSPLSLLIESLIEQICKLMEHDPRNQRKLYLTVCGKLQEMNLIGSSYSIDEFQFLRSHYQKSLYNLLRVARQTSSKAIISSFPSHISVCSDHLQEPSRYTNEFIELDFIAKGGFGAVFKAQHKLDGSIYAVKKIFLRYRNLNSFNNNLMEVKMLARLNHPNIVAYKAAWLEPVDSCTTNGQYEQRSASSSKSFSSQSVQIMETECSQNDSLEVVFTKSSRSKESVSVSSVSERAVCEVMPKYRQRRFDRKSGKNECAILYIQMQYCSQTLRRWIDVRNSSNQNIDIDKCIQIFKQNVAGLQYIHSQNIVHHDIKPSNIFISDNETAVQVGDFGLACGLIHGTHCGVLDSLETRAIQVAPHRPGRIGTELYAAPEQLKGDCNSKSDIFSLGIVLFELIVVFHTSMERSKLIGKLKQGDIPTDLKSNHAQLVGLLERMVNRDSRKRPSATEVLSCIEDIENQNVRKLIKEQQVMIESLREESLAKDRQIAELQEELRRLSIQHNTDELHRLSTQHSTDELRRLSTQHNTDELGRLSSQHNTDTTQTT